MKNNHNFKTLALFLGLLTIPAVGQATSLLEVYQQALQSDPRIHEAEARRLAALEAEPQARGLMLPQVNFSGDWTNIQASGPGNFSDPDNPGGTLPGTSDTDIDDTNWNVSLRQTVFRWDQIVGLRQADKIVAKAEANREFAQQDLVVRVGQRYFDVLAAEDRLTSTHANRQAIARQLEQAKQRFEVGLIAITDVQESQAAHDQAVADEIAAKRVLATAREFLREITGQHVGTLSAPGDEFPMRAPNPASEAVSYRRNGHYPTIDLVARTGSRERDGGGTARLDRDPNTPIPFSSFSESDSDTIGIEITVPLFSGGRTSSRVREAVYLHRAAREQLQRVTRETERSIRDSYLGVLSEMSRVEALKQAVASSQTALEATQAGFEVGTRTIVDVLDSQFALYRSITLFYQSRYDYLMNVLRLKQAAGNLQIQDLEEIDQWLKERKRPEDVFAEEAAAAT